MSVFTYISLFSLDISSYIILGIYCRYLNVYICFVLFLFVAYYSNSRTESNIQMIHTTRNNSLHYKVKHFCFNFIESELFFPPNEAISYQYFRAQPVVWSSLLTIVDLYLYLWLYSNVQYSTVQCTVSCWLEAHSGSPEPTLQPCRSSVSSSLSASWDIKGDQTRPDQTSEGSSNIQIYSNQSHSLSVEVNSRD